MALWRRGNDSDEAHDGVRTMTMDDAHLDRAALTVGSLDDDDAARCWRSRTPAERLAAVEHLRQVMYGYDPTADRLQRVLEVVELGGR